MLFSAAFFLTPWVPDDLKPVFPQPPRIATAHVIDLALHAGVLPGKADVTRLVVAQIEF